MDIAQDQKTMTESGLVLKNVKRVADIRTRMEVNMDAHIHSWQVCRVVRRDFHLVTSKLYIKCLKPDAREQADILINEFVMETEFLKAAAEPYQEVDLLTQELSNMVVPLRVVSKQASIVFKTFMELDAVIFRLKCAKDRELLEKEQLFDMINPAFIAFNNIKRFAMQVGDKTAAELAKEIGVL